MRRPLTLLRAPSSRNRSSGAAHVRLHADTLEMRVTPAVQTVTTVPELVAAINEYNNNGQGSDTIVLDDRVSLWNFNAQQTDQNNILPRITSSITIGVGRDNKLKTDIAVNFIYANTAAPRRFFEVVWLDDDRIGDLDIRGIRFKGPGTTFPLTGNGGAIYVHGESVDKLARIKIDQCQFEDFAVRSNNDGQGNGGAVAVENARTFIQRSTMAFNQAELGGGLFLGTNIFRFAGINPRLVENCTIHGNITVTKGGGIAFTDTNAVGRFDHITVTENRSIGVAVGPGAGAGMYVPDGDGVVIQNSILVDNTRIDVAMPTQVVGSDLSGVVAVVSYSFVEFEDDVTIGTMDNITNMKSAELAALSFYGGPTETRIPVRNSVSINAGNPAFTPPPTTDQRGAPRVQDKRTDIGAVEVPLSNADIGGPFRITDNRRFVGPGETVQYVLTAPNLSGTYFQNALLQVNFPPQITSVYWWAQYDNGATGPLSGVGNMAAVVQIPVGGRVNVYFNAIVNSDPLQLVYLEDNGFKFMTEAIIRPVDQFISDPRLFATASDTNVVGPPPSNPRPAIPFIVAGSEAGRTAEVVVYDPALVIRDVVVGDVVVRQDLIPNTTRFRFYPFGATFTGGVRTTVARINNDDYWDIVCAAGPGGGPHVKIYDGLTGYVIDEFFAFGNNFTGGVNVAAGNLDNDPQDLDEIITGAGPGGGPHVRAWSVPNHQLIRNFFAYDAYFKGGVNVTSGDIDGVGPDEIVTAPQVGAPHVRVFSGTSNFDLAITSQFFAYNSFFRGGVYLASEDFDGNGQDDIVTAPGFSGGPHVKIYYNNTAGTPSPEVKNLFPYVLGFTGGVRVGTTFVLGSDSMGNTVTIPRLLTATGPGVLTRLNIYQAEDQNEINPELRRFPLINALQPFNDPYNLGIFVG